MRSLALLLCTLALMLTLPAAASAPPPARTIVVYYFHRTIRCSGCTLLENTARAALTESFARDLRSGRVVWKPLNLDDEANAHFESRYSLEVQTIVVSEQIDGKEKRWKRLDDAWDHLYDAPALKGYVVKEVRGFLGR